MDKYKGMSIFEGITIAKGYIKKKNKKKIEVYRLLPEMLENEIKRFKNAVDEAKRQITALKESLGGKVNQNDIKILNVHLMLLEDPVFLSDITNKIKMEMLNAEKVVETVVDKYVGMFKGLNDPMYKQRSADVEDVGEKIIMNLQGDTVDYEDIDDRILIAKEIKPSELLNYHNLGVNILGLVTETGGETSHVAILAKTLGIPTLMNVRKVTEARFDLDKNIILDTRKGKELLVFEYDDYLLKWYEKELTDFKNEQIELKKLISVPAETKCGEIVKLYSNMGAEIELENVKQFNSDGIGLLRTEFLYMESEYFPTEEEQFLIYKKITQEMGEDKTVIIRTLDIGADKKLSYFEMPTEENPFLGLRAIRLSLLNKDIFKVQLRAILRAAYYGDIKIMYPMIASVDEVLEANEVLAIAKKELKEENKVYNENIEVGIMVEIPSTVILADVFSDIVDFFSIGTNDLTQYVLAADRLSEEVSHVYDGYHPAVFRMIAELARVALLKGKKLSICGELGGDPMAVLAFLSFGIREFSMLPAFIPKVKKIIRSVSLNDLAKLKEKILTVQTSKELKGILNDYLLGVI